MGYQGGPPYWVQKENEAFLSASHHSQISQLQKEIEKVKEENSRLKAQLDEITKKYQACMSQAASVKD